MTTPPIMPFPEKPHELIGLLLSALCCWVILCGWLFIVSQEKFFLMSAPALLPMGFFVYARLHNHFHEGQKHDKRLFEACGIALSSILGLSWALYRRHHANHHQFNNGTGDFARTMEQDGTFSNGSIYILRSALKPYFLQLVPFLSLLGVKPSPPHHVMNPMACKGVSIENPAHLRELSFPGVVARRFSVLSES